MKSGPNFKLPKSVKRILATYIDPHKRGVVKRGYIQAQLASQVVRREKHEKNKR